MEVKQEKLMLKILFLKCWTHKTQKSYPTQNWSLLLSDSLKKLETRKNQLEKSLRKKISNMQSQAKLREKKAKILQQLQREHPNAVSPLKKLEVTPGQVGRLPLEGRMMGLHQAILSYFSSYL